MRIVDGSEDADAGGIPLDVQIARPKPSEGEQALNMRIRRSQDSASAALSDPAGALALE